jgi:uncharacterized protein with PIN domain
MTTVTLTFYDNLQELLYKKYRTGMPFRHQYERRSSIKDVIESLGIPHPVVGKLIVNSCEVDLSYILKNNDMIEAMPLAPPVDPTVPTKLRPVPLNRIAFIVDVNVGKLALYLRMLGFDTLYDSAGKDKDLATTAWSEKRILLTRDTALLKRKIIAHGYLLREPEPKEQLKEVMQLYNLGSMVKPMSRCIPCNGLLVPVSKEDIINRLEPLTRKYYNTFHTCDRCGKLYWPGSHHQKMKNFISAVLQSLNIS